MPCVVYSDKNTTSRNIGRAVLAAEDFEELERVSGFRHFRHGRIGVLELEDNFLDASFLDDIIKTDLVVFVCSHRSSKGVAAFTAHSEGNWTSEAALGGKPKELSMAAPARMLETLASLKENNKTSLPVIYEATHHGPLLETPSFFVEVGGNAEALESEEYARVVAKSVIDTLSEKGEHSNMKECVLGIGGLHYAEKFTRMAFEKGYAFSHIMPKYYASEIDMLDQAVKRSSIEVDKAVIEWKSIKAIDRERIIAELDRIGIDHERA